MKVNTTDKTRKINLFVVETEEIYRHIYRLISADSPINLLGISGNLNVSELKQAISVHSPDLVLIGTGKVSDSILEELGKIRADNPGLGFVLLMLSCVNGQIDSLKRLTLKGKGGMALFLRHSLVQTEQLVRIVEAVSCGQFMLDPALANLMLAGKPESPFLGQLTRRELEIINLLARGYSNSAIAEALYIDSKTVEHHLNSIYSKLKSDSDFSHRHLRVAAARLYLQEVGELVHSAS